MDKIYITEEGLEKLKAELAEMKERRIKVADAIEYARSLGDLKENAEYHAAKEEQAMLHAKIKDVEDKVSRSVILDTSELDNGKAYVGATVKIRNKKNDRETTYQLVSPVEADMENGKISIQSPVGKSLLGKAVGEIAEVNAPAGLIEFELLDISY